jgi:hypothetical protein
MHILARWCLKLENLIILTDFLPILDPPSFDYFEYDNKPRHKSNLDLKQHDG